MSLTPTDDDEPEAFFADEEANWEPYAETLADEKAQEQEFDAEYQRYLDEMGEAMVADKELREEIIEELKFIDSADELKKEDKELLKIAHRLQEEDLRSALDEQERQIGVNAAFYFSAVEIS